MFGKDTMIPVAEAAKRLNRTPEQLRRALRQGRMRGERVGRQWFVDSRYIQVEPRGYSRLITQKELMQGIFARLDEAHQASEPLQKPRHELLLDLSESEGSWMVDLCIDLTEPGESPYPGHAYPLGVTLRANAGAHDADLHLSWENTKELRDTLSRLLRQAGCE
jgi:excisionase family DNA binding protein